MQNGGWQVAIPRFASTSLVLLRRYGAIRAASCALNPVKSACVGALVASTVASDPIV